MPAITAIINKENRMNDGNSGIVGEGVGAGVGSAVRLGGRVGLEVGESGGVGVLSFSGGKDRNVGCRIEGVGEGVVSSSLATVKVTV